MNLEQPSFFAKELEMSTNPRFHQAVGILTEFHPSIRPVALLSLYRKNPCTLLNITNETSLELSTPSSRTLE